MKKDITNNSFTGGLVMDLNPLLTPNNVLTNCLNGTLITYNGNEQVLQNDMGNGRVETAMLPEGYIPLGTTELGGIIYIVSYNPLIGKCQIGSFPSPERNILSNETDGLKSSTLNLKDFYEKDKEDKPTDIIKSPFQRLILHDRELNPGDKFLIYSNSLGFDTDNNKLDNLDILSAVNNEGKTNPDLLPKYLKLNVVSIQEDGSIIKLNDSLIWNDIENDFKYYIKKSDILENPSDLDVDEYRDLVLSNYNVFNSKVKGKLAILAELECISAFDVSWDVKKFNGYWNFYFYLNWEYENTQARDQINLYGIRVNCKDSGGNDIIEDETVIVKYADIIINKYPNSNKKTDTDILNNSDNIFYTPYYVDSIDSDPDYESNGGITTPRKNDGTDNQFLLYEPIVLDSNTSGKVTFTVSPLMPFGCLDYLKKEFTIDLDLLNSGLIDLKLYKYYYEPNGTTIYWGLDYYPEGKKKIKEACFNFYKFDENVRTFVQNNNHLENYKRIDTKGIDPQLYWEGLEESEVNEPDALIDPIKEKISQASYSGYFSNVITSLEDNQLYLVELDINYNDELNIKYYRFLYTCDIFNDEFYNEDDFKNIKLLDKLNIEVSSKFDVNYNDHYLTPDNIDHFLDNSKEISYKIKDTFKGAASGIILYNTSKYKNIFSVNAETSLEDNNGLTTIIRDLPKSNILLIGSNPYNTGDLKIESNFNFNELKINNNTIDFNFELTFTTPLNINYNNYKAPNILYELKPIILSKAWLEWFVNDNGDRTFLTLVDDYTGKISDDYTDKFKDEDENGRFSGNIGAYPNVFEGIKQKLLSCDILMLCCRVFLGTTEKNDYPGGNERRKLEVGPTIDVNNQNYYTWYLSGKEEDVDRNGVFIMYAVIDNNNSVLLFTFGSYLNEGSPVQLWGDIKLVSPNINESNYVTETFGFPVTFYHKDIDDVTTKLLKLFKKYNKASNYSVLQEDYKYFYGTIKYFEDYKWIYDFKIDINYEKLDIKVNNVKINDLDINNLQYIESSNSYISGIISDYNYVYKHISDLISRDSIYTKLPDGTISSKNIGLKLIYSSDGNVMNYIKREYVPENLNDNSLQEISVEDNKLKLHVSTPSPLDKYGIFKVRGVVEKQHLTINNVLNINYVFPEKSDLIK